MYLKMISYEWQTSRYRCGIKVKYSVGTLLCHLYLFFIIYKEHFIHIIGCSPESDIHILTHIRLLWADIIFASVRKQSAFI